MSTYPIITLAADQTAQWWQEGLFYHAHPCGREGGEGSKDMDANYDKAVREASLLVQHGYLIYSPVIMTVPIAKDFTGTPYYPLPKSGEEGRSEANPRIQFLPAREDWFSLDFALAQHCKGGLLLGGGWQDSLGCQRELGWFEALGLPVYELRVLDGPTAVCEQCGQRFLASEVRDDRRAEYGAYTPAQTCIQCHRSLLQQIAVVLQPKAKKIFAEVWGVPSDTTPAPKESESE